MCGIVGYYNFECENRVETLLTMRDSLTHRGPDDAGVYIDNDNCLGLGHRRLSVIDLSYLGHQPMSNEDETVWIIYNGEIYNYKEIRAELVRDGFSFRSNSDTEVVLKAYLRWGVNCVNKFIGMFAIAIWDKREKKLYLIRDRIGIKPLYYYFKEGSLLFGSELKALMAHPDFPREINFEALPGFLRYGYIPAPLTIFQDTFKLKPGHYLCIQENKLSEIKYWDANDYYLQEALPGSEDEIADELEDLLINSFKYRLLSDVPVGIFLSGGIDSTTLTALLQKNTNTQHKTFTIGFYEDKFDEAKWAKEIALHLGTDHTEYYVSVKDCMGIIEKLPEIYDEPFADNSAMPTYLLSKLTKQNATVALSADGGDELFGGYNRYRSLSSLHTSFLKLPKYIRNKIIGTLNTFDAARVESVYNSLRPVMPGIKDYKDKYEKYRNMLSASNDESLLDMYKYNVNRWTPDDIDDLLTGDFNNKYETYFEDSFHSLKDIDFMSQMMAIDLKTFLLDDILTKVDRASMSVSLEAREPFLDHRLVQYAARIPSSLKCRNGTSKYILRKILYKYVPKELVDRPKKGFVVPLSNWLKGDLRPLLMDYLNEDRLRSEGIFNEKTVANNLKGFLKGSVSVYKIWFILMFQMWKERWL